MLTTVADIEDAEGVERTQSDDRGRTAMTEDAERWVRFAKLRLRMLTTPSSSPRAKVAFMCGLPNRRTVVWSADLPSGRSGRPCMWSSTAAPTRPGSSSASDSLRPWAAEVDVQGIPLAHKTWAW